MGQGRNDWRALRFLGIHLKTTHGERPIDLDHAVLCVAGPISTGKTTLADALFYPLGMSVDWREVAAAELKQVTVALRINGSRVVLRRPVGRGSRQIEVLADVGDRVAEESLDVEPVQGSSRRTIDQFLLEASGLGELIAPARAVPVTEGATPLGFRNALSFLYLSQDDIDRARYHGAHNTAAQYKAMFELLFGLADAEGLVLKARRQLVNKHVQDLKRTAERVKEWLASSTLTNEAMLLDELEQASLEVQARAADLTSLRARVHTATAFADPLRTRVTEISVKLGQAQVELGRLMGEVENARRQIRDLKSPSSSVPGADILNCISCGQDISGRPAQPGECHLCTQAVRDSADAFTAQRDQLTRQLKAVEQQLDLHRTYLKSVEADLCAAQAEFDRVTRESVTPLFDEIAKISAAHAAAQTRVTMLKRALDSHERLHGLEEEIAKATAERDAIDEELRAQETAQESREKTFAELDERFSHITEAIGLPHSRRGQIDPETYQPRLAQGPLTLVSHGERTVLNVAHRVALLSYSLISGTTDLPSLLVIDTPSKNVGHNDDDGSLLYRVYSHFIDAFTMKGSHTEISGRKYQVIIFDNDLPEDFDRKAHVVRLKKGEELLPIGS